MIYLLVLVGLSALEVHLHLSHHVVQEFQLVHLVLVAHLDLLNLVVLVHQVYLLFQVFQTHHADQLHLLIQVCHLFQVYHEFQVSLVFLENLLHPSVHLALGFQEILLIQMIPVLLDCLVILSGLLGH